MVFRHYQYKWLALPNLEGAANSVSAVMSKSPPVAGAGPASAPLPAQPLALAAAAQSAVDREKVYQWIIELAAPDTREAALLELSKKRKGKS